MIGVEVPFCEKEHVPYDRSLTYWRNYFRFGKAVADFYTYLYPVVMPPCTKSSNGSSNTGTSP